MTLRPPRTYVLLTALIGLTLVSAVAFGHSQSAFGSLLAVLASAMPLFPLCLGAALVIAVGEIDLSVAGSFSLFGMLLLGCASLGIPPMPSLLIGLGLAFGIGWALGYFVVNREVPSLVASLATAMVLIGISLAIDHALRARSEAVPGSVVRTLPPEYLLPIFQYGLMWSVILLLVAEWWRRSPAGIRHIAVGMDRQAATFAAIPVGWFRRRAFVGSSLLCYLACILFITGFQQGGWSPRAGQRLELVAIAVAVIGGTRVTGGGFRPLGAFLAIILWEALAHLQVMIPEVGPEYQELAAGLLLAFVAASGGRLRSRSQKPLSMR